MRKIALAALAVVALAGCTNKVEKAYQACVAKQTDAMMKQAESGPAQLKDTLAKEGHKLSEAACGPIKTMCKDDFDATMCQQMIKSLAGSEYANQE